MTAPDAPWHAHIYLDRRAAAEALRADFQAALADGTLPGLLFVGSLCEGPAGPHPIGQYEIHFHAHALPAVRAAVLAAGVRALLHPLTDDDLADHTSLADWIGEPLPMDLSTLDPPGMNQGVPRFGLRDF